MWKKTKRKIADLIRSASFTEVGVALDYSANWQTREDHNLVRARTQFKMVQSMEDQAAEYEAIVAKYR